MAFIAYLKSRAML